jgi:hypothetical protein
MSLINICKLTVSHVLIALRFHGLRKLWNSCTYCQITYLFSSVLLTWKNGVNSMPICISQWTKKVL